MMARYRSPTDPADVSRERANADLNSGSICGFPTNVVEGAMTSSAARSFSDPDDFASSIRATRYEMTVTGRGRFAAELVRINLHDLWMQRFSSNLPWISHAENLSGRAIFVFHTQAGADLLRGVNEMRRSDIARLADGQSPISERRDRYSGVRCRFQWTRWLRSALPWLGAIRCRHATR